MVRIRATSEKEGSAENAELDRGQAVKVAQTGSRASSVDVPPELGDALEARPDIGRIFAALAPSHRREYADWIASAKKPATKAARAERALTMIAKKQHRP